MGFFDAMTMKMFSNNVKGCRDGSAKNHRTRWQCASKPEYTMATQIIPSNKDRCSFDASPHMLCHV